TQLECGRILHCIWPPQRLAVPGEVYRYETHVADGGTSEQFARARQRAREDVEDVYAAKLVELKIEPDDKAAADAAHDVRDLPKVKEKILDRRRQNIEEADRAHNDAMATANKITDAKERDRAKAAANDAYNASLRAAYRDAYDSL